MKIIMLDIDGVLNNSKTKEEVLGNDGYSYTGIDQILLQRFKRIVVETGAKIVVSSTWRKHKEFYDHLLNNLGELSKEVIGSTPNLFQPRCVEIDEWLREHKDVDKFIVIDDLQFENLQKYGEFFCNDLLWYRTHRRISTKMYKPIKWLTIVNKCGIMVL